MNAEIIAAFAYGVVIALFMTPIYVCFKKFLYYPMKREKILNKAIEQGHVVKAKLVKTYYSSGYTKTEGHYVSQTGIYEYSYNGKIYHKKIWNDRGYGHLSEEVQLNFIDNPSKTEEHSDRLCFTAKSHWIRSYFLIVLIITILFSYDEMIKFSNSKGFLLATI